MGEISKFGNILSVVTEFVNTNKRGMETFRLQALGFSKAFIQDAIDNNVLEARKGRTGGIYPFGMVPEVEKAETLKSRMVDILRTLGNGEKVDIAIVHEILDLYDAECQKRSDAKKKNTDNDD